MQKRLFIIHRWDGSPQKDWLPWAKDLYAQKGYNVTVPHMPNPEEPKIEEWILCLKENIGIADEHTYFIGHSIGCQTIMRYLEAIHPQKVGGVVCVAGWFTLMNLEDEDSEKIAKPWLETPIDYEKVQHAAQHITVILSDNDPFVPLSDKDIFEEKLCADSIVEHKKGHFTWRDGVVELPALLRALS